MIPDFSSLVTKKSAKNVGIPSTVVIMIFAMIMSNGGEYTITNPIDDVKDIKHDLKKMKKEVKNMKKQLESLTDIICSNPEFTCKK